MPNYMVNDVSLTSVANAIRVKGGTSSPLVFPEGFVTAIENLPTESTGPGGDVTQDSQGYLILNDEDSGGEDASKSVKFIDYDGRLLYSYTAAEANALTALPNNPSHAGLTAQGWNYTLQQLKIQVTAVGEAIVGQMYVTDDNKTRIYCHFDTGQLSPYLGICPNGTVTVDWGDNSSTDTLTGTSESTVKTIQHVYAEDGDYVITLAAAAGTTFAFNGSSTYYSYILRAGTDSTTSKVRSHAYRNAIKKIELGSAAKISNYAFAYCYSLKTITMPSNISNLTNYGFYYCVSLKSIVLPTNISYVTSYTFRYCYGLNSVSLPYGLSTIDMYAFSNCSGLKNICIPSSVNSWGTYLFYQCYNLNSITIPSGVTTIGANSFYACWGLSTITMQTGITSIDSAVFYNCYCLASITIPASVTSIGSQAFYTSGVTEYHLRSTSPPTLSNTNAFTGILSSCIIYVPKSENQTVLNAYKTAANWSTYADYMQEEPE